jgi:hypothetical protein
MTLLKNKNLKNERSVSLYPALKKKSSDIYNQILKADAPENFIKTVPSQSLYIALKNQGLQSSSELLSIATLEQVRACIDLDMWSQERFYEEQFWEWAALVDDTSDDPAESLSLLQKILKCIDLKVIAIVIGRYVEVITFEQQQEYPPEEGFYTPDRGSLWLKVTLEDSQKHFYLNRLLALLFETNADMFYQLMAVPSVATESILEEEAYAERNKRLSTEYIPDPEYAASFHKPLQPFKVKEKLTSYVNLEASSTQEEEYRTSFENIPVIGPLLYDNGYYKVLKHVTSERFALDDNIPLETHLEALESESSLLMNAALVYFSPDFSKKEEIAKVTSLVKNAINIGIESIKNKYCSQSINVHTIFTLQDFYAHGIFYLFEVRKKSALIKRSIETVLFYKKPLPQFIIKNLDAIFLILQSLGEKVPMISEVMLSSIQALNSLLKEQNQVQVILKDQHDALLTLPEINRNISEIKLLENLEEAQAVLEWISYIQKLLDGND